MKPVYMQIKEALVRRLIRMPLGTRLPSDRDLAQEHNVAFLTINRVMNALMNEGYVVRRPRQGTFVASHSRQVATQNLGNGNILVAYPMVFSHHIHRHISLAQGLALKHRVNLLEYKLTPASTPKELLAYARQCPDLRGLFILPVPTPQVMELMKDLDSLGIPVVIISAIYDLTGMTNLHCVDTDWFAIGKLAGETMLRAGHRRLAWVNHEAGQPMLLARGLRQALKDNGMRGSDLVTLGQGIAAWADSRESGYRLSQRLIDEDLASAAYFTSIAGVRGALRALWERGMRAPEHLSLICSGNQSGDEDYLAPPLTTIDADWEGEMQFAFDTVLGKPAERIVSLPPRLMQRSSISTLATSR